MATISKDKLEKTLHRRLLWHEYTDKGTYIDGGLIDSHPFMDVMLRVTKQGDRKVDGFVKCLGSDGFCELARFEDGVMCAKCQHRTSPFMMASSASPSGAFEIDLTSPNQTMWNAHRVVVPKGCPHSTGEKSYQKRDDDKEIGNAHVGEWNAKHLYPLSWKIVENGDKLTLSIQYRSNYMDLNKLRIASKSLYCHISCNLKNGQTYISDLHDEHTRYRTGVISATMETLTFTGSSSLLSYMPDSASIVPALVRLNDVLRQKLREKGFELEDVRGEIPSQWAVPFPAAYRNTQDLLREIAIANRFPTLGTFPLLPDVREMMALYIKRRFDKLPRTIRGSELQSALGVQETPNVTSAVMKDPTNIVYPVMLDEWGFDFDDIESFAEDGFAYVKNIVSQNMPRGWSFGTYDTFDALSIAVPLDLCDIKKDGKRRREMSQQLDDIFEIDMNEFIQTQFEKVLVEKQNKYRKFNRTWQPMLEGYSFDWDNVYSGASSLWEIKSSQGSHPIAEVGVSGKMYLDRRAYNKKEARKFVELLKATWGERSDSARNDSTENTDDGHAELAAAREHMIDVLSRAIRFTLTLNRVELLQSPLDEEQTCRVIYEWAYKNEINIALKLDYQFNDYIGRKVRKDIMKRAEKARDARRNARKNSKKNGKAEASEGGDTDADAQEP